MSVSNGLKVMVVGLLLVAGPLAAQVVGDINDDGKADSKDLAVIEQYIDGSGILVEEQSRRADLNSDGVVDGRDANVLRSRLGLAVVSVPTLSGRASGEGTSKAGKSYRAGAKNNTFVLGVEEVVPEWVRGTWRFGSQVLEANGAFRNSDNGYQNEQISLPGDLSGMYVTIKVGTGERMQRLCWQVDNYSDERFRFTERFRDESGVVYASIADISNQGPGRADIRIRTEILDAGRYGGGGEGIGGLFGWLFGNQGGGGRVRVGDSYTRGGQMSRSSGTERTRLPDANLESLRCR